MTSNLLNVQIEPRINEGRSAGFSRGSVMRKSCDVLLAPSTSAASYKSLGIEVNAPRQTTIMNGTPSHTFVIRFARNAVPNEFIHDMPSRPSRRLIAPRSGSNIERQLNAVR